MKCPASPPKHRHGKRGRAKDYAHGMRGHKWIGHGNERKCARCERKPK